MHALRPEFDRLADTIKRKAKGQKVYYVANPGNWGDALIRYGTLKFFREYGIPYQEVNHRFFKTPSRLSLLRYFKNRVAVMGGGGAWCEGWQHGHRIARKMERSSNVIVLPSSFEYFFELDDRTMVFARDKFESRENMPMAEFCHDMAFFIDGDFKKNNISSGTGYFFRSDKESAGKVNIPESNIDLSTEGGHLTDVSEFFRKINRYSTIYTDRLHVGIAAGLLEKEVHLYQSRYFKIKAIYNSTIRENFDNIELHENFELR